MLCQIRAEEGRQSRRDLSRSGDVGKQEACAKRLRCGPTGDVEVVRPAPLPSLLPLGGAKATSALSAVRVPDIPTGGVDARGAVPSAALSTLCLPKPHTGTVLSSSSSSSAVSSASSSSSSFSLPCQSVVQAPRRPCSFVLHHSVVGAPVSTWLGIRCTLQCSDCG